MGCRSKSGGSKRMGKDRTGWETEVFRMMGDHTKTNSTPEGGLSLQGRGIRSRSKCVSKKVEMRHL
jgi:hypothetical protein